MRTLPFQFWRIWIGALVGVSLVAGFALKELPDDKFHIWFLDVGQGDAILIKTPENHQILIDGGPDDAVMEQLSKVMPFFDRSLDLVVLTHPHEDHVNGLVAVLKHYRVDNVLLTGVNNRSGAYNEFLDELIEGKINFYIADHLEDFHFGEVFLDVLFPFEQLILEDFDNLNNSSIVMKLEYKDVQILLTGDAEKEVEDFLLEQHVNLKADVLKAGHHGSKTSSSLKFLAKVRPKTVVIQVGKGNSYGHPSDLTLRNFAAVGVKKVYRNDLDGRVELVF